MLLFLVAFRMGTCKVYDLVDTVGKNSSQLIQMVLSCLMIIGLTEGEKVRNVLNKICLNKISKYSFLFTCFICL